MFYGASLHVQPSLHFVPSSPHRPRFLRQTYHMILKTNALTEPLAVFLSRTDCGGVFAFEIFEYDVVAESLGCWVDDKSDRLFETTETKSDTNTPEVTTTCVVKLVLHHVIAWLSWPDMLVLLPLFRDAAGRIPVKTQNFLNAGPTIQAKRLEEKRP